MSLSVMLVNTPRLNVAAGCAPAPGPYTTVIIGGPRTALQVREEIETIERHLNLLKLELMNMAGE